MADYRFENINVSFGTDVIYKNFSIEFEKNRITTILGRSGCGKTTLLNYIMKDIMRYENLSCVFQEEILVKWLTVYENIELVLKNKGLSKREKNEIIIKNLRLVNLNGLSVQLKRRNEAKGKYSQSSIISCRPALYG